MNQLSELLQRALMLLTWCIGAVRHAWVRLVTGLTLVILATWFTYTGYTKWQQTIDESNSCNFEESDLSEHFRYIQFTINSQNLRDPEFIGSYFINLGKELGKEPYRLNII